MTEPRAARETADPLRLLGLSEVARLLGTDRQEVIALVEAGQLPCIRVGVSREPRVSQAMLAEWQAHVARSAAVEGYFTEGRRPRRVRRSA